MLIRFGHEITVTCERPTPLVCLVAPHHERLAERIDGLNDAHRELGFRISQLAGQLDELRLVDAAGEAVGPRGVGRGGVGHVFVFRSAERRDDVDDEAAGGIGADEGAAVRVKRDEDLRRTDRAGAGQHR